MAQRSAMREEEVNRFKESQEIFDKFFRWLFGVIAFKNTDMGEALFIAHPNVMMVIVLMIVLYFLVWIMGTMLPHRIIFLIVLVCIIMLIGSVFSVLVLTIVSPHVAWLTVLLWVAVFVITAYYFYQEFYNLVAFAILDTIKDLFDSYRRQSTRVPV